MICSVLKLLMTFVTFIWCFPCVASCVGLEMARLIKLFTTYITLKTSLLCMGSSMLCQGIHGEELFAASFEFTEMCIRLRMSSLTQSS